MRLGSMAKKRVVKDTKQHGLRQISTDEGLDSASQTSSSKEQSKHEDESQTKTKHSKVHENVETPNTSVRQGTPVSKHLDDEEATHVLGKHHLDDEVTPEATKKVKHNAKTEEKSNASSTEKKPRGLVNHDRVCYANDVLQTLASVDPFREYCRTLNRATSVIMEEGKEKREVKGICDALEVKAKANGS